jgi:hypothetical protein
LQRAINNPVEIALMATKAQKYVMFNYSWQRITADNLKIYESLYDSQTKQSELRTQLALTQNYLQNYKPLQILQKIIQKRNLRSNRSDKKLLDSDAKKTKDSSVKKFLENK